MAPRNNFFSKWLNNIFFLYPRLMATRLTISRKFNSKAHLGRAPNVIQPAQGAGAAEESASNKRSLYFRQLKGAQERWKGALLGARAAKLPDLRIWVSRPSFRPSLCQFPRPPGKPPSHRNLNKLQVFLAFHIRGSV